MALSNDLISQFVKATRDKQEVQKESTAYGKIVKQGDKTYVQLDGSDLLTPISSTTVVRDEDRVMVTIKNHTAIVTGDFTNPSANDKDVQEIGSKISEFEIIIADKVSTKELEAEIAKIDKIIADDIEATNAKFETIEGKVAEIDTIKADVIEVEEKITAHEGEFTTIRGDIADFKDLTTENIEVINGNFHTLESDYADFKVVTTNKITANEGAIDELETKKLDAESAEIKYANIDFANIGEAAIRKLFSDSGIIKDLIMSDGKVTGELVGVTIKGDIIEGNTVKADKLVILGEDGLYYKLNVNALGESTASSDEKYQNGLDGSIIVAESITAEKIAVDDLVAFGATIGGYHITDHSLYSGVKNSVSNTTQGVFLGDDGQVAIGDSNNYLKFFVDENGEYKLEIKASSIEFGASDSPLNDLKIGGRNLLLNSKEGYSYTDSNDISEINDKLVTILSTGEGYSSCSIKDKISIPLTDFLTKNNESIALSLDTKVTGSFTNLQYAIKVELENVSSTFPILSIPDACKKNTWFRIDGVDKSIKWPQFFNYEDYKSKSGSISLDENGWFIANCNNTNGDPGTTLNYTCLMNILNNIRPNSKYNIFIEVKDVVGEGKISLLNNTGWTHFKNDHSVNINESSNGLIVNFISPTRSDFSNINYGLYIIVAVAGGKSCSAKFRISIIEDLDITPENFIYKPYVSEDMEPIDVLLVTSWDNAEVGSTAEYRLPKLELGTIASQWTPAPEDTEKSIDDAINDITNNYYTKTETDANFSIQSDRITSAVSKIEIVEKSIDDIEIGGRNLLLNTSTEPITRTFSGWQSYLHGEFPFITKHLNRISNDQKLTLRAYLENTSGTEDIGLMIHFYLQNDTKEYVQIVSDEKIQPGESGWVTVTGSLYDRYNSVTGSIREIRVAIRHYSSANATETTCNIHSVKLEIGNKPTDWTPAPEDMENNLINNYYTKTETDSKFEIESDRITSTVTEKVTVSVSDKLTDYIAIGGTNLLLDSDIGYPYTHSLYPDIAEYLDKKVTVTNTGKGCCYCLMEDNISVNPIFKLAEERLGEFLSFSLDSITTGSFTNLRFGFHIGCSNDTLVRPIAYRPDDYVNYVTYRLSGKSLIEPVRNMYNYNNYGVKANEFVVDDEGWVTLNYTSTSSLTKNFSYYIKYLYLDPNTNHNVFMEIKNVSGNGSIILNEGGDNSQLETIERINFNELTNGSVICRTTLCKADSDSSLYTYSLKTNIYVEPGETVSITFRLSILYNLNITPETFVYDIPNPDIDINKVVFYVKWDDAEIGSTVEYSLPKLEYGNKPTEWTPAPEDVTNKLDEGYYTKDEVDNRFSISETTIQQLSNSISMLVRDSNGSSLMTQTSDGWVFSTDSIEKAIQDTLDGLGALSSEIGTTNGTVDALQKMVDNLSTTSEYVKIGAYQDEPCIELGESDSDFKLLITNTRILFLEGSNVPVYISNNSLYGKRFIVEDELQQGGFVWIEHGEGNLGLSWKGGNQ